MKDPRLAGHLVLCPRILLSKCLGLPFLFLDCDAPIDLIYPSHPLLELRERGRWRHRVSNTWGRGLAKVIIDLII